MKDNKFINTVAKTCNKLMFSAKKHSPEICLAAALVTGVVGVIYACKKSTELPTVLENGKARVEEIKMVVVDPEQSEITVKNEKVELAKAYIKTGTEVAVLYAGPAIFLVAAGALVLTSHGIIKARNAALSAAYTGISTTFATYRGRVAEKYGEEAEQELRYGITSKTVEQKVTDENGEVHTVQTTVDVVNPGPESDYVRYLTPQNPNWDDIEEYMELFFNKTQRYANDLLCVREYVYLNLVYEMLGLKQSKAGQHVGWRYRRNNEHGDNHIQFIVKKVYIPVSSDPNDGYQPAYMMDFNVDGDIYKEMEDEDYFET